MSVAIDGEGRFSGYASVFNRLDLGGDIVMPGAFAASLARRRASGIRLLFQHDPKEPVGLWDAIAEDETGLRVEGRLLETVPRAKSLASLVAAGAVDGLSIGFRAVRTSRDKATGHRRLWQIDLWEISIVTFPMLEAARIGAAPKSDTTGRLRAAAALMRS